MSPPRLHHDEVAIDAALVRALVAEQLPEYAGLPLHRVASGGTEHAVFRLGEELAIRMPMTPGAVAGLLKEVRWLPVLRPHLTLDVPEVVAIGQPGQDYPFPWTVVRWLAGDDASTVPFESLAETAVRLGRFVSELQGIDVTEAPAPGSEGFTRGLRLAGRDAGVREVLPECEGLIDVRRVADVWDDALAAPEWTGPPVWLHADLIPGNLLVRGGRLAGILDFGTVATGDPAYDVTAAWHVLHRASRPAFLEIVGADEATIRRARGLVVSGAVVAVPYYLHTNPTMVAIARRGVEEVLADRA
jgi:aminoglycoside phosphotransferase (APT) family kinase protein